MAAGGQRAAPLVAAALILAAVALGWAMMPRLMLLVSGAGPVAGVAVALAFMLSFFAVLWLRARQQRRFDKD